MERTRFRLSSDECVRGVRATTNRGQPFRGGSRSVKACQCRQGLAMPIRLARAAIWSDLRKRLQGGRGRALAQRGRLCRTGPVIQASPRQSSAGATLWEQDTASVIVLIVLPQDLDLLLPTIDRFKTLD